MRKVLLLMMLLSVRAFAEEGTKFDYVCEWREGQVQKFQRYHINSAKNIVDGKIAVVDENYISFVKDGIEHKIDRRSGVVETRSLKSGGQPTEIKECKKVPPLPIDFVLNPH